MQFKNPSNNYPEEVSSKISWLWCLLFGPIYWIYKGIWRHAIIHLILAIITAGGASLVYPFFTYKIIRNHFNRIGWVNVD